MCTSPQKIVGVLSMLFSEMLFFISSQKIPWQSESNSQKAIQLLFPSLLSEPKLKGFMLWNNCFKGLLQRLVSNIR